MDVGTRVVPPIEFLGFRLPALLYGYGKTRFQLVDDPELLIFVHPESPNTYRVYVRMHENVYPGEDDGPMAMCLTYTVRGTLHSCERAIRAQRGRPFPWEHDA